MRKGPKVGFIGQGYVGKNYADDFERRGLSVIRYSLEKEYFQNKDLIKKCDVVFIAVPTPTLPKGFDGSVVKSAVKLVGKGKIAVIKSTVIPGTTESIQKENPGLFVLNSPEFLTEANAAYDAARPRRNIIGISENTAVFKRKAKKVMKILPRAPFEKICAAKEAEIIKYAGNCFLFTKVVYSNLLYNLARSFGADWENIREALSADPRVGASHLNPVHQNGRGAGGHCFIKDFAAFRDFYGRTTKDRLGWELLQSFEDKNNELLLKSGKDKELIQEVYGKGMFIKGKKKRAKANEEI